jgi:hypothetical protein
MEKNNEPHPVEVFSGTIWNAELLKSVLEDAGIMTFLFDENTGTLAPWYTAGGGAGSVKVVVSSPDQEEARKIVEMFEQNLRNKE